MMATHERGAACQTTLDAIAWSHAFSDEAAGRIATAGLRGPEHGHANANANANVRRYVEAHPVNAAGP